MREADLYAPIVGGMAADGMRVFRIADGSAGKKPFDAAGCTAGGRAVGLEAKAPTAVEAARLQWALFETHQRAWLRDYARRGALALAAVYCRRQRVLHVWALRAANDMCERPADAVLSRDGGQFRGWEALTGERNDDDAEG